MKRTLLAVSIACLLGFSSTTFAKLSPERPPLSLAKKYQDRDDVGNYWVSEKMDGARAYWNGKQLLSRNGNVFHAPAWFTEHFPAHALDGELWMGRGSFELLMQTVRDKVPDESAWREVRYWVFDLPLSSGGFEKRSSELQQLVNQSSSPYIQMVKHLQFQSSELMYAHMRNVVANGGEGLMLQRSDTPYQAGRHPGLLKLKPFHDAEAVVIGYRPGKGKYKGMVGALVVQDADGLQFRLGSGLSDLQRREPPPVGAQVSYRYQGRTAKGLPRFARFLRARPYE